MTPLRPLATALVLALAAGLATGCGHTEEEARAWALSASNTLGTLETQTPTTLDDTIEAFDAALAGLGWQKGGTERKELEAVLTWRGPTGTTVTVKLKRFPAYTNIKVRAGLLGEETLARDILAQAYRRLD